MLRLVSRMQRSSIATFLVLVSGLASTWAAEPIPHGQTQAPNAPLTPAEAVRKMTLPDGFRAEVVACEPDIVNPVAMTFDERGRIWITESLEYPRHSAGPGRDRVKVLEDTDGDGKADKFTVFAEGLNIPSGIAVGHGGVWVANAPDILFLRDTDGDGKADTREVVVTGFGRFDTHELPNSLTWGPDGWLYGWNGVFNRSRVVHRGKTFDFTCAIFRIHPRTRDFELFCEGTSNPWGIAWNLEGAAFASACVIDHLWHLTETGYYIRQGGPYPAHTWPIGSIVDHQHQKAAYCGTHFFDSDAYPAEYRERLYMGNIHGNGVNVDRLERNGSTYRAVDCPDFLRANDAWFMPVVQKTGPDGCLYVLDWYDRYHCYQDANRDPAGIDRLKGRLYRIRYRDTPRRAGFDLAKSDDASLVKRLGSGNVYDRDIAQRLLVERNSDSTRATLESLVLDTRQPRKARIHALWALVGTGTLRPGFHAALLRHGDSTLRAWGVRGAGNMRLVDQPIRDAVVALAHDPSPDVLVQVVIASRKIEGIDALAVALEALSAAGQDPLIPHVAWQNVYPVLEKQPEAFASLMARKSIASSPGVAKLLPRALELLLSTRRADRVVVDVIRTLEPIDSNASRDALRHGLTILAHEVQSGSLTGARLEAVRAGIEPLVRKALNARGHDPATTPSPLFVDAAVLATAWGDVDAKSEARSWLQNSRSDTATRVAALRSLITSDRQMTLEALRSIFEDADKNSPEFLGQLIAELGRLDEPRVADTVLQHMARLKPELRPKVIELLAQRPSWSRSLINAVRQGTISASDVNVNQVRRLVNSRDPELAKQARTVWGTVREGRNSAREKVIAQVRELLRSRPGDPHAGKEVFARLCGQCHKIHGEGQDVGPEITSNGRASYEQLLSNVLDPSLVIGSAYQATNVATVDGRIITGLIVENSPERIVLKTQGGKLETIARDDIDEVKVSALSLMPEDLEKQLKPQELADLLAFITLDKHPADPSAQPIPGAEEVHVHAVTDPDDFPDLLERVAPGFTTTAVGEGGLVLFTSYRRKHNVLRTHPLDRNDPCTLRSRVTVPAGKQTALKLSVSYDPHGDWQLEIKADGQTLLEKVIGPATTHDGWAEIAVDLSKYAGKTINLELINRADDWAWEFAYWANIRVVSE